MPKTHRKPSPSETKPVAPSPAGAFAAGRGMAELEQTLRRLAVTKSWDVQKPLPTTREIGDRYHISNASVCRLLIRLDREGVIWRQDKNGRYFLNESRRLFERRKPYACLLRELQSWSRVYQGIMGGFSQAFGRDRASMLFVHNESLVRHADTAHPPAHAGAAAQRESLAEFFRHHTDEFQGILFDEVWLDEVLQEFSGQIANAVIVCRSTTVPGLSSVGADFDAGALLAIGHLYARGFDEIRIAVPFGASASVTLMTAAASRAAALLGKPIEAKNICSVATPAERYRFTARLKTATGRVGVFCLEDNMSLILREKFEAEGLACPAKVGLISAMGTELVVERRLSSLLVDFKKIGHAAGDILLGGRNETVKIAPGLFTGITT